LTAIEVVLADLPLVMEGLEGQAMWLDEPVLHPGGLVTAGLRCDPLYRDWSDVNIVHVMGEEIVPGATYEVRAAEEECIQGPQLRFSAVKSIATVGVWGDIAGAGGLGDLDGVADFSDISAAVSVFISPDDQSDIVTADLSPGIPNQVVNFVDIAFRNLPYPYVGPVSCP
jgi:hypothetical protein